MLGTKSKLMYSKIEALALRECSLKATESLIIMSFLPGMSCKGILKTFEKIDWKT
jgi:hypothetical protein